MKKVLVLAACMLFLVGGVAQAAYTTSLHLGAANYTPITGQGQRGGGSFDGSTLGGQSLGWIYCVDVSNPIYGSETYPSNNYTVDVTTDGKIHGVDVVNKEKVAYLLEHYAVDAAGNKNRESALQAAIWFQVSSGAWSLGSTALQETKDYYDAIFTAGIGSGNVSNFSWLSPTDGPLGKQNYQGLVTPIPGAVWLLGSGLAGLVGIGRFRRKRTAV